jgi:hypothetical protein
LNNSTVWGNSACAFGWLDGGGIYNNGALTLNNSTVSGNSGCYAGGIGNEGTLWLLNTTVTDNTANTDPGAGGVFGGVVHAWNSIIAGNTGPGAPDRAGNIDSLGHNLIGNTSGGGGFRPDLGDLLNVNPRLGPLADNGGSTLTHALLPGSPAIDAGDPMAVPGEYDVPEYDQRGAPYARVDVLGGQRIDIGAFEVHPPAALAGDYNLNGVVDAADYVVWRKTLGGSVTPYTSADGNGDCKIDDSDRVMWRAHFGQTLPAPGTAVGTDGVAPSSETPISPTAGRASDAAFDSYGRAYARGQETNAQQIVNPESEIRNPKSRIVRLALPALLRAVQRDELLLAAHCRAGDEYVPSNETALVLPNTTEESAASTVGLRDQVFELLADYWAQESADFAPASMSEMSW